MGEGNTRQQNLTGSQMSFMQSLAQYINPQVGQGIQAYSGQIAPDASALQRKGFDLAANYGNDPAVQGALQVALSGRPGYDVAGPEAFQKFYGASVEAPAMETFRNDTMREIANKYGTSGAGQAMAGEAGRRLAVELAGQKAAMGLQGLQNEQGAFAAADARRLPAVQVSQAERAGAIGSALDAGKEQYTIAGRKNAEQFNKWEMSQPWNNPAVARFGQMLLGTQSFSPVPGHGKF